MVLIAGVDPISLSLARTSDEFSFEGFGLPEPRSRHRVRDTFLLRKRVVYLLKCIISQRSNRNLGTNLVNLLNDVVHRVQL